MPNKNPELEKLDTDALPEGGSEDEHEPTSNEDDEDWRIDDAMPHANDDDLDASPGEDHLTTEEKELDRLRSKGGPKSPANSVLPASQPPGSATAKEQNTRAPEVDDDADLETPDLDDDDDLDAPDVDDGATPQQPDKPKAQPKASSETKKPKPAGNAMKHGMSARDRVLPGEKRADLERLYQNLIDEWGTGSVTVNRLVDRLTSAIWTQDRVERFCHRELELALESPLERELGLTQHVMEILEDAKDEGAVMRAIMMLDDRYQKFLERDFPARNTRIFAAGCRNCKLWRCRTFLASRGMR